MSGKSSNVGLATDQLILPANFGASCSTSVQQKLLSDRHELLERTTPGTFDLFQRVAPLDCLAHRRGPGNQVERVAIILILVRGIFPAKVLAVHVEGGFDNRDARDHRLEGLAIEDVNLNSAARLTAVLLKRRDKYTRTEIDARQTQTGERRGKIFRVDVWGPNQFERSRSSPPLGHLRAFKMNRTGENACRVYRWYVRRRQNPWPIRVVVPEFARPPGHRHGLKVAIDPKFGIEQTAEFDVGHPASGWNRKLTDKRSERRIQ